MSEDIGGSHTTISLVSPGYAVGFACVFACAAGAAQAAKERSEWTLVVAIAAMCDFAEVADELACKFLILAARSGGYNPPSLRHVPAR